MELESYMVFLLFSLGTDPTGGVSWRINPSGQVMGYINNVFSSSVKPATLEYVTMKSNIMRNLKVLECIEYPCCSVRTSPNC
jgi:hypothetical protein